MSSFYCEKCGKAILDTPDGYTTGCEHYPLDEKHILSPNMRGRISHEELNYMAELWLKFLILTGFRSKCCGAKIFDDEASGYSHVNRYCSKCNKQIS